MAIGFEAFDLAGRVTLDINNADKVLIRLHREAKKADSQITSLEKTAKQASNTFQSLNVNAGRAADAFQRIAKFAAEAKNAVAGLTFRGLSSEIKESVAATTALAREEKAVAQAKQATLNVAIKEVQLAREKLKLTQEQERAEVKKAQAIAKVKPPTDTLKTVASREIAAIEADRRKQQKITEGQITTSEQAIARIKKIQSTQAANAAIADLKRVARERKQLERQSEGTFSSGFGNRLGVGDVALGAFAGGLAAGTVLAVVDAYKQLASAVISFGVESTKVAASYERTRLALTVIAGSAAEARTELAELQTLARVTPGLNLEAAEEGAIRLRSVGFEARETQEILVGLSKLKILSGASKQDLEGVIFNLSQIRSIGKLTGDELRETLGRLPASAQVFQRAFGTISTEKIRELNLSSQEFFERFTRALREVPQVAGGAQDAWEKLTDQILIAQRQFGEPILEPLTEAARELTSVLANNQSVWREWGKSVANVIQGGITQFKNFQKTVTNQPKLDEGKSRETINQPFFDAAELVLRTSTLPGQVISYLQLLEAQGKAVNDAREVQAKAAGDALKTQKDVDDEQVRNYKQTIDSFENLRKVDLDRADAYYTSQIAIAGQGLRLTAEQELTYQKTVTGLRNAQANDRVRRLEKEIADTRALNEAFFKTVLPEDLPKQRAQKEEQLQERLVELEKEKSKALSSQIDDQNKILELELRIAEAARQAAIEFKELSATQIAQNLDRDIFNIEQLIDAETLTTQEGIDAIIEITNQGNQEILRLMRERYDLQFADARLSGEQQTNLLKQMNLEEQRLTEENSRRILALERQRAQKQLEEIERLTEQRIRFLSNYRENTGSLSFLGETTEPIFARNFDKLLDQAKTLKATFDASNQSLADFFKTRSEYYSRLAQTTVDEIERQKRIRDIIIPDAQPAQTDQPGVFMPPLDAQPQATPAAADPNKRIRDADKLISKLEADVLTYKGITASFAREAQRFADYANEVNRSYGSLQSEVFSLYDAIQKGVGDHTIFDQIIEKNYLANRELQKAELAARVNGLREQVVKAQKDLADGLLPPSTVTEIQTNLIAAEQALAAFNFETEKGAASLDTLANAQGRYNKLLNADVGTQAALRFQNEIDFYNEQSELLIEINRLKYDLANSPLFSAQDREIVQLEELVRLRNEERGALASRAVLGNRTVIYDRLQAKAAKDAELQRLQSIRRSELAIIEGKDDANTQKLRIDKEYHDASLKAEQEYQEKLRNAGKGQSDDPVRRRLQREDFGDSAVGNIFGGLRSDLGLGALDDAIFGAQSDEEARLAARKEIWKDYANTLVDVFGQMAGAAESVLATFILTGEGGADAIKQLVAQTIASIAVESGVKAIFQLAEGFAALARFDPISAAGHFASAKLYGAVALGAAAVGIGIGLAGGLGGGKKGQQGASGGFDNGQPPPDYYTNQQQANQAIAQPNRPVSPEIAAGRQTTGENVWQRHETYLKQLIAIGERQNQVIERHAEAVANFDNHITSVSDGEIFIRGANKNRGEFADRTVDELKGIRQGKLNDMRRLVLPTS